LSERLLQTIPAEKLERGGRKAHADRHRAG
jgi:hypothetical protein